MYLQDNSTYMPHNYLNESSTFYDASSATLMAASVYRLASLTSASSVSSAETFYSALSNGTSSPSSINNHTVGINSAGWLNPVVNPTSFSDLGTESPEGQSFVLMLEAARKDWQSAGSKGQNGGNGAAGRRVGGTSVVGIVGAALVLAFGAGLV